MSSSHGHVPVLLQEVLAGLQVRPGGRYVDATLGAGGHAASILDASAPNGLLLGLDTDPEAVAFAQEALRPFGTRVVVRSANFRKLEEMVAALGFEPADGVLMDLGLSSRQLDDAFRGFSFAQDGPLDMRMDTSQSMTAAYFVNQVAEAELADLIWRFGEERDSRRIARAIVRARPITSTTELAELVARTRGRRERIHPATRTFQALRIAVNDELASLSEALPQASNVLRAGGRLAIISFHSLEDRIVKRFFQQEARDCICPPEAPSCTCQHNATVRIVTRKAIRPGDEEIAANPRSRSARLRIAERLPPLDRA